MSRLEQLREHAEILATRLRADDGKLTAGLAKERRETLREIDAIESALPEGESIVDELTERRDAARLAASGDAPAAGGSG